MRRVSSRHAVWTLAAVTAAAVGACEVASGLVDLSVQMPSMGGGHADEAGTADAAAEAGSDAGDD